MGDTLEDTVNVEIEDVNGSMVYPGDVPVDGMHDMAGGVPQVASSGRSPET